MSQDFRIACKTCKKALWAGQRDHLYTTPASIARLEKFLFEHVGREHELIFAAEHFDYEVWQKDYEEVGDYGIPDKN